MRAPEYQTWVRGHAHQTAAHDGVTKYGRL